MAQKRKAKMTGLRNVEIREMSQILIDLQATIQTLSKVAARLDKYLKGYEQPVTSDENGFHSAEDESKKDVKSVQGKVSVLSKRQKQTEKVVSSKAERSKTENVRRSSRAKSVTNEAVNMTVVNKIEEDKKKNASDVKIKHVKDMKRRFELRSSRSINDSDQSGSTVRSNEETVSEKINKGEVKVNVRSLKEKFEQDNKESKSEQPKNEEKVKVAEEQTSEYEDKVKKVLKYFQPMGN